MDILPDDIIKKIGEFTEFDISKFAYTPIIVTDCILMRLLNVPITIEQGIKNALSATEKFAEVYRYKILDTEHFEPHTATETYTVLTHSIIFTMIKSPIIYPIAHKLNVLSKSISEKYKDNYMLNYQEPKIDFNKLNINDINIEIH